MEIGQEIKITKNKSCHCFEIGEIVRVVGFEYPAVKCEHLDKRNQTYVTPQEFELIK